MNVILSSLDTLRRIFIRVVMTFNAMASVWIFLIMLLITLDIVMRFAFGGPIDGVTEIVEISIVIVLFLQMTDALRAGRITRSDAMFSRIIQRAPKIGHALGVVFNLSGAGLMMSIAIGGWPKWIQAYDRGYFIGNVGVFTFPEWPQLLVIVIGCSAMAIQFLLIATDNIRGMAGKPPLINNKESDRKTGASEGSATR